jgi:hypothetical protein
MDVNTRQPQMNADRRREVGRATNHGPRAWRGAALQRSRSAGWQQAASGNDQGLCSSTSRARNDRIGAARQSNYAGLFPGAACCQPTDLPSYKAAPLQALGVAQPPTICVYLRLLCLRGSDRHYPIRGQVLMTELAPQKLDRQGSISRRADSVRIVFDDRFSKARRFT